jgi:hypothetical protein
MSPLDFIRLNLLLILMLLLLSLLSGEVHAGGVYVLDGGTGDGTAWNNALDAIPAIITRGDTVYIGDGEYGAYTFDDAEVSTTYITVIKATEAEHGSGTGWVSTYGDGQAVFDPTSATYTTLRFMTGYWIWDGQVATTPSDSSTYGFKVLNTSAETRTYSIGITPYGYGSTEVDNVTIKYTALPGFGTETTDKTAIGIYSNLTTTTAHNDSIIISHCYTGGFSSNFQIRRFQDSIIEYTYFDSNWSSSVNHGQQISAGGYMNDLIVRGNTFVDSYVFILVSNRWDNNRWDVYNNIIIRGVLTSGLGSHESALADILKNSQFHHNTFIGTDCGGRGAFYVGEITDVPDSGSFAYNNLFINCTHPRMDADGWASITYDYNAYYNCSGTYTPGVNAYMLSTNPLSNITTPQTDFHVNSTMSGKTGVDVSAITETDLYDSTRIAFTPGVAEYDSVYTPDIGSGVTEVFVKTTGTGDTLTTIAAVNAAITANTAQLRVYFFSDMLGQIVAATDSIIFTKSGSYSGLLTLSAMETVSDFTTSSGGASVDSVVTAASADDVSLNVGAQTIYNSTKLPVGLFVGNPYITVLNFTLTSAQLANVDSIILHGWGDSNDSGDKLLRLTIRALAQGITLNTAEKFNTALGDTITVGFPWNPGSVSVGGPISVNITALVDSFVNLPDYTTSNVITIFILDNGLDTDVWSFESLDGNATLAPRLYIYSSSVGTGDLCSKVVGSYVNRVTISGSEATIVADTSLVVAGSTVAIIGTTLWANVADSASIAVNLPYNINSNSDEITVSNLVLKHGAVAAIRDSLGTLVATNVVIDSTGMANDGAVTFTHCTILAESLGTGSGGSYNLLIDSFIPSGCTFTYTKFVNCTGTLTGTGNVTQTTDPELTSAYFASAWDNKENVYVGGTYSGAVYYDELEVETTSVISTTNPPFSPFSSDGFGGNGAFGGKKGFSF